MSEYTQDVLERAVASFAGGMLAVVGAVGADLTDSRVWLGGLIAGALAVLKSVASRGIGDRDSGSVLR